MVPADCCFRSALSRLQIPPRASSASATSAFLASGLLSANAAVTGTPGCRTSSWDLEVAVLLAIGPVTV